MNTCRVTSPCWPHPQISLCVSSGTVAMNAGDLAFSLTSFFQRSDAVVPNAAEPYMIGIVRPMRRASERAALSAADSASRRRLSCSTASSIQPRAPGTGRRARARATWGSPSRRARHAASECRLAIRSSWRPTTRRVARARHHRRPRPYGRQRAPPSAPPRSSLRCRPRTTARDKAWSDPTKPGGS